MKITRGILPLICEIYVVLFCLLWGLFALLWIFALLVKSHHNTISFLSSSSSSSLSLSLLILLSLLDAVTLVIISITIVAIRIMVIIIINIFIIAIIHLSIYSFFQFVNDKKFFSAILSSPQNDTYRASISGTRHPPPGDVIRLFGILNTTVLRQWSPLS